MDTKKYTNKLQKSSVLFLQLGLVLTLLTTYLAFELKTEQRATAYKKPKVETEKPYEFTTIDDFQIEEKIVKKSKQIAKKKSSPEFKIDKTDAKEKDALPFEVKDTKENNPVETKLVYVEPTIEVFPEDVPYTSIQEVPIFPGCEKVKESKKRACFDKKMSKHIQSKFNSELANQLGLSSGKKRIWVEFLITKTGEINITNASAPHVRLEKEGKRVVEKLPTMTPGKQNGKAVGVKYTLPISFEVE